MSSQQGTLKPAWASAIPSRPHFERNLEISAGHSMLVSKDKTHAPAISHPKWLLCMGIEKLRAAGCPRGQMELGNGWLVVGQALRDNCAEQERYLDGS